MSSLSHHLLSQGPLYGKGFEPAQHSQDNTLDCFHGWICSQMLMSRAGVHLSSWLYKGDSMMQSFGTISFFEAT